jgi:hypothetical protein
MGLALNRERALELVGDLTGVRLAHAMNGHEHFRFSVTIRSEEFFIISAMRGLARACQPEINHQIAAAGAGKAQWKRQHCEVTFYFTCTSNRKDFIKESALLFRRGWEEISQGQRKTAPRQSEHGFGHLPPNHQLRKAKLG